MKSRFTHILPSARRLSVLLAAVLVLLGDVRAQGPSPAPPYPTPNQRNPFPKNHHDPQNTGRALEEKYWGVTNGNQPYFEEPEARRFSQDGWVFPREAANPNLPGSFPLRPAIEVSNEGQTPVGGAWEERIGPGQGALGNYQRQAAVSRGNRAFGTTGRRFRWEFSGRIPGTPGPNSAMTRYQVYVWLPARNPNQTPDNTELRISDARYRVFYTVRTPSGLQPRESDDLYVNQDVNVAGWYPLQVRNEDGTLGIAPFFPFYPGQQARVELEDTTDDPLRANQFVIADDIQLRQQFDVVGSTPTVTARHGGRRLTGEQQPDPASDYTAADFTNFTDDPSDPSVVSTLFQGPASYLNPNAPTDPANNNRYQNSNDSPRPLFSHMQVLLARTEHIIDPRDPSGTGSIQVGAVYGLDWLTGAPVWRFPDRSFAPNGPRNPLFNVGGGRVALIPGVDAVDQNGNGIIEDEEVFIVGLGVAGYAIPNFVRRGNSGSGGLSAAITFEPQVPVRGVLTERRLQPDGTPVFQDVIYSGGSRKALAYVASNNGVIYALDAYGNSDGVYVNPPAGAPPDTFGQFVPGTTNVVWVFNPVDRGSLTLDNTPAPGTGTVVPGTPTPWEFVPGPPPGNGYHRKSAVDRAADPTPVEPSTFVWQPALSEPGLYTIIVNIPAGPEGRVSDARYTVFDADNPGGAVFTLPQGAAGQFPLGGAGRRFAFRPGVPFKVHLDNTTTNPDPASRFVVADFLTFVPPGGGVPEPSSFGFSSPVVEYERPFVDGQNRPLDERSRPSGDEKRLFVGNDNGILYAMSSSADAESNQFAGGAGQQLPFYNYPVWWFRTQGAISATPAVSARELSNPAVGDPARRGVYFTTQEGRVYCVDWQGPVSKANHVATLPLYNGTSGSAQALNDPNQPRPRWTFPNRYVDIDGADNLPDDPPDSFGGVRLAAPSNLAPLFSAPSLMDFPLDPGDPNSEVRSYVVLAANDTAESGSPGKVYLLDPAGDRRAFLTNPQTIGGQVAAHPLDRYAPGTSLGNATPVWTHRYLYGTGQDLNSVTEPPHPAVPALRTRPTVFVGAIGRVYAVDIDPATNVFVRWPEAGNPFPGPDNPAEFPPDDNDALDPPPPGLPGNLQNRPVLARLIELQEEGATRVNGLAITGGPPPTRGAVPNPTYNPNGQAVNQNIDDPLTQDPLSFQYPALYATTAGGFLHELSTNTEGEDRTSPTGGADTSSALGWALTTDTQRANPDHVLLDTAQGPGGTSGLSVASNVVFEGLDPFTGPGAPPFRPRGRASGDTHTGQTGFPLDHQGLFNDPYSALPTDRFGALQIPNTASLTASNNQRLGNHIVWVFSGGPDGVAYAYTPGTFSGGGTTGPGGRRFVRPRAYETGEPKVDIFNLAEYETYFNAAQNTPATRPDRGMSRAAQGEPNFFEWGETVYIVVWDVNNRRPEDMPDVGQYYAEGNSVIVTIIDQRTGAVVLRREIAPEPGSYPYQPDFSVPPQTPPEGVVPPPLGLAFLTFRLDGPSRQSPQTPGARLEVRVTQTLRVRVPRPGGDTAVQTVRTGGTGQAPNDQAILNRLLPMLSIANPLGVAGTLRDMFNNPANPATGNQAGPFDQDKTRVFPQPTSPAPATPATDGSTDPDRPNYQYSQALANGNIVERYEYRPYTNAPLNGAAPLRNRGFKNRLPNDPAFYLPVAASTGFIGHGASGSTATTTSSPMSPPPPGNLVLLNRSLLPTLGSVRAARTDLLWRFWPGRVPNADATDFSGTNPRTTPRDASNNPVMTNSGVINPLPWDEAPLEVQPWKRAGQDLTPTGTVPGSNPSTDYPDIPRTSIEVRGAAGDLTTGRATLPAPLQDSRTNVEVRVPRYQPANLVAVTNLTSTYVGPNPADGVTVTEPVQGPLQLPRGINRRQLRSGGITPFGYTTRVLVYVDADGDGQLNLAQNTAAAVATVQRNTGVDPNNPDMARAAGAYEEAYRVFEVWSGVPVEMGLKSVESVVDMGSLPHGFGIQNGLLGYGSPGGLPQGFVPPPMTNVPPVEPYRGFYRSFTVQNTGNVNLWNVRSAQRAVTSAGVPTLTLQSDLVNRSFGIGAFGADPNLNDPILGPNTMGLIVTSLDRNFDTIWATSPLAPLFAPFGGRHTLHKPKPGAVSPTLLALPDTPDVLSLPPGFDPLPKVGVAVPLGTPVGTYAAPLPIFEDHDTAAPYQPFPLLSGDQITPAGPLYAGRNNIHPGDPALGPPRPILPVGAEGILRPRRLIPNPGGPDGAEYLPYTEPSFVLKVSVQESPLTGQVPDNALPNTGGSPPTPPSIQTGVLPGVDLFPLIDTSTPQNRPASALTPAAFRSAVPGRGSLHLYFSRNATGDGPNGTAQAQPGQPFRLFRSHLLWDNNHRVWRAANFGQPVADPTENTGRWFTQPVPINVGDPNSSNTSPFVLHDVARNGNVVNDERATLFWQNTRSTPGGAAIQDIWYATLNPATGEPGTPQPYLSNPDPAIRRFAPKAVAARDRGTVFTFYYGGVEGRWSLFYSPRQYDGTIGTQGGQEFALNVPAALSSVSEPNGVYRTLRNRGNPSQLIPIVDLYYTGISRVDQNPNIYMTRYRIDGNGGGARLVAIPQARVAQERLSAPGRDPVWVGRHIAWYRLLDNANRASLPQIYIQTGGTGNLSPLIPNPGNDSPSPMQRAWEYDDATGLLFLRFNRTVNGQNTLNIVYVDPSAGTVRFRGQGIPTGSDVVYADYTPQTLRLTRDAAADLGASVFQDRTILPAVTPANGYRNEVIRRPADLTVDRQWVVWQKGAEPGRASTLFHNTRRVGVDLKAIPVAQGGMLPNESLLLGARDGNGNQPVAVEIRVFNGTSFDPVPYDVDFRNGRIYVEAQHEGLPFEVSYTATQGPPSTNRNASTAGPVFKLLNWIDEGASVQMISMQRSVNEAQPSAFLDLFDGRIGLSNDSPRLNDPTLQPWRVWLFWTSPRGRTYDLYWQTIAPYFESPSFSGLPPIP